VTVPSRLNVEACKGVFPAKFRNTAGTDAKIEECFCDKEGEIGAWQVFPVLEHRDFRTPTVKHFCDKTRVAAVLRQVSNKVLPDDTILHQYRDFWKNKFQQVLLACVEAKEREVDLWKWLKKQPYNQHYKKKLIDALKPENRNTAVKFKFGVFPKKELQYTPTHHIDKETDANTIKERQICGPPDEMKVIGNAFFNCLEGAMHEELPQYCGRANWLQITEKLQKIEDELADGTWIEGDGSGFDMTQTRLTEEVQTTFLKVAARSPRVVWSEPLDEKIFVEMLEKHTTYVAEMLNRKTNKYVKYDFDGRPSGAGNTTLSNTLNMIAYNEFVMYIAKIPEKDYRIIVKGDDLLIRIRNKWLETWKKYHSQCFTSTKTEQKFGLGQIMPQEEIKYSETLDGVSFLSSHFMPLNKPTVVNGIMYRYRMLRILPRVLQTISWTTNIPTSARNWKTKTLLKAAEELSFSKGASLLTWSKGLPIFNSIGRAMTRLGSKGRWTERNFYADEPRVWFDTDNRQDYLDFIDRKYGITKQEVVEFEKKMDQLQSLQGFIRCDWFDKAYN